MTIKLATLVLIVITALGSSPVAAARDSSVDGDWAAVIAQPKGTRLRVKMKTGETVSGEISNVSESELTLVRSHSPISLERAKIKKVYRVAGRQIGKSTMVGLGVGTAAGVAIGSVVAATDGPTESGEGHLPIVIFGVGGAII